MLERAALHQTRFRTPGVAPDARGVVIGGKGVLLFPSLDRLVAFFRAYGDTASIDELMPSLSIRQLVTTLKTREVMVSFDAESSYRMDRVSGTAKLAGGLAFTGTSRHFVKYRDAASPLGYDVQQLLDERADIILYHDTFEQPYSYDREIGFGAFVNRLTPERLPSRAERDGSGLFMTAEVGVGAAIIGYLFRWQVDAGVALAEWPSDSAFEDRSRRLYVFELNSLPERMVDLFSAVPGTRLFSPVVDGAAVECGYRHPIDLSSCPSLFDDGGLRLFGGDGVVDQVRPRPVFAPVHTLVRSELQLDKRAVRGGAPAQADLGFSLPLRLAPTIEPWRAVVATVVPSVRRDWLARILYALPPGTLAGLRMAVTDDRIYLLKESGIESVPIGTFFCEVAARIYVPAGMTLTPAVSRAVLEKLVGDRGDGHAFFDESGGPPRVIPNDAFGSVSRRAIRAVAGLVVHAQRPPAAEPGLPALQYGPPRRFPLWGLSAADLPADPDGEPE